MKLVSAAAAAQLMLLPLAGNASADLIPETAKSAQARAELNQKTSDLPSFGDVGESLKQNLGFGNDPKNIGKAIDANTPDVDLTKNPKDVVKDLGRAIDKNTPDLPSPKDIGRAVDRNTPDLPNPREVGQAFPSLGSGNKPGGLGSNVDNPLPNPNQAKDAVTGGGLPNPFEAIKNAVSGGSGPDLPSPKDIGRAVDRNTPDLPNPRDIGQALPNLGSGNKPGGLGSNVDNPLPNPNQAKDALTGGGLPNPFEAIKNAVSGGSGPDLPDPRDAASKITGKGPDVKGAASDIKNKVDQATPDLGNPLKGGLQLPDLGNPLKGGLPGSNVDTSISTKPI
eukprot:jgi/Botrbrau1/17250/Bobra.0015s0009.1